MKFIALLFWIELLINTSNGKSTVITGNCDGPGCRVQKAESQKATNQQLTTQVNTLVFQNADILKRFAAIETEKDDLVKEFRDAKSRLDASEQQQNSLIARIGALENNVNTNVAFMGVKTTSFITEGPTDIHVPVPNYEVVITNIGNAFNSQSGIFTSPVDGVFTFTFSFLLHEPATTKDSFLFLYHNNIMICAAYSADKIFSQLSNTAVISLKMGDTVNIRQAGSTYSYSSISRHATFSGALLF